MIWDDKRKGRILDRRISPEQKTKLSLLLAHAEQLGRYFQYLMWLGRLEFPPQAGLEDAVRTWSALLHPANFRSFFGFPQTAKELFSGEKPLGIPKVTVSSMPFSSRTLAAPSSLSRTTISRTDSSGADAPPVTPIRFLPATHSERNSSALSTL